MSETTPELVGTELETIRRGACPDCGDSDRWLEGPHGGECTNWMCGNCGSRFNIGPLFVQRISEPSPRCNVRADVLALLDHIAKLEKERDEWKGLANRYAPKP